MAFSDCLWIHIYLRMSNMILIIFKYDVIVYLTLFTIRSSMTKQLERLQRNFLWGTSDEEFKLSLVAPYVLLLPLVG